MRRRPGVMLAVLLSLSLGIGVNAAVFSIVNAVLLKSIPGVREPQLLITTTTRLVKFPGVPMPLRPSISYPFYRDLRRGATVLSDLAVFHSASVNLEDGTNNQGIEASLVSDNFFKTLGITPLLGNLEVEPEKANRDDIVVIAQSLWRRLFGAAPEIVGRRISLNGHPFYVIGIPAGGFRGPLVGDRTDVWIPITAAPRILSSVQPGQLSDPAANWLFWMVGRLRRGANLSQAQEELDRLVNDLERIYPTGPSGLDATAGIGFRPGESQRAVDPLVILFALAGIVFLTACANVANLYLIRDSERRAEIGIRLALGAGRSDIVGRYMADCLITSLLGGSLALWMALVTTKTLEGVRIGQAFSIPANIALDLRVLGFTFCLSLIGGILIGLFGAFRMSSLTPGSILSKSRGAGTRDRRLNRLFVTIQIASSLVLLIGAGLLIQTFQNLRVLDLGFQGDSVVNMRLDLSQQDYPPTIGRAIWEDVQQRVMRLPGIDSVSLAHSVPLDSESEGRMAEVAATGRPRSKWLAFNIVSPGYFNTLGIPLIEGRGFTYSDASSNSPLAVVNETLASSMWPGKSPVGQRVKVGSREHVVIGLAKDVKLHGLDDLPEPYFYLPIFQKYEPQVILHLRGERTLDLLDTVRSEIRQLDSSVLIYAITPMRSLVERALSQPKLAAGLVGLFSLLGLVLAALGLYAVISESILQRLPEFGIRIALGGPPTAALGLALRASVTPLMAGLAIGYGLAYFAIQALRPFLYGVEPMDFFAFTLLPAVLVLVALSAALVAAWPALRVNPLEMLRCE